MNFKDNSVSQSQESCTIVNDEIRMSEIKVMKVISKGASGVKHSLEENWPPRASKVYQSTFESINMIKNKNRGSMGWLSTQQQSACPSRNSIGVDRGLTFTHTPVDHFEDHVQQSEPSIFGLKTLNIKEFLTGQKPVEKNETPTQFQIFTQTPCRYTTSYKYSVRKFLDRSQNAKISKKSSSRFEYYSKRRQDKIAQNKSKQKIAEDNYINSILSVHNSKKRKEQTLTTTKK